MSQKPNDYWTRMEILLVLALLIFFLILLARGTHWWQKNRAEKHNQDRFELMGNKNADTNSN